MLIVLVSRWILVACVGCFVIFKLIPNRIYLFQETKTWPMWMQTTTIPLRPAFPPITIVPETRIIKNICMIDIHLNPTCRYEIDSLHVNVRVYYTPITIHSTEVHSTEVDAPTYIDTNATWFNEFMSNQLSWKIYERVKMAKSSLIPHTCSPLFQKKMKNNDPYSSMLHVEPNIIALTHIADALKIMIQRFPIFPCEAGVDTMNYLSLLSDFSINALMACVNSCIATMSSGANREAMILYRIKVLACQGGGFDTILMNELASFVFSSNYSDNIRTAVHLLDLVKYRIDYLN